MATKYASLILFVLAIWAVDLAHGGSSHQAPAPSVDCSSLVIKMADCLSFVTNGSTTTKPEGNCCSGLKSVLKTKAECLCEAFKSSAQFGLVLNLTKATTLPAACKVSAAPISNCGLSQTPASAPGSAAPSPTSGGSASPVVNGQNDGAPLSAPTPSPSSGGSPLLPISAGSFLVCFLVAAFSAF